MSRQAKTLPFISTQRRSGSINGPGQGNQRFSTTRGAPIRPPASQHSKCILVDGATAFITSANFTESAHERNVELGVLFRDNPRVAESIRLKFESLIQNEFLKPLASS
jgi:phosphatidylserine/phosphatidylglycerophosphate/cardiolipin synthase-like enzyme